MTRKYAADQFDSYLSSRSLQEVGGTYDEMHDDLDKRLSKSDVKEVRFDDEHQHHGDFFFLVSYELFFCFMISRLSFVFSEIYLLSLIHVCTATEFVECDEWTEYQDFNFKFSSDCPVTFSSDILLLAGVIILQLDVDFKT